MLGNYRGAQKPTKEQLKSHVHKPGLPGSSGCVETTQHGAFMQISLLFSMCFSVTKS